MMKFTATTALRWFGFRQTLIVIGLVSARFAACALFTPSTPHLALAARPACRRLFCSLVFTALNAIKSR